MIFGRLATAFSTIYPMRGIRTSFSHAWQDVSERDSHIFFYLFCEEFSKFLLFKWQIVRISIKAEET